MSYILRNETLADSELRADPTPSHLADESKVLADQPEFQSSFTTILAVRWTFLSFLMLCSALDSSRACSEMNARAGLSMLADSNRHSTEHHRRTLLAAPTPSHRSRPRSALPRREKARRLRPVRPTTRANRRGSDDDDEGALSGSGIGDGNEPETNSLLYHVQSRRSALPTVAEEKTVGPHSDEQESC